MTQLLGDSLIKWTLAKYNNKIFDVHEFHALSDFGLFDTLLNHQNFKVIFDSIQNQNGIRFWNTISINQEKEIYRYFDK